MPRPFRTQPMTTVSEIESADRVLADIGRNLIMEPGSVARVVWHALKNWMIDINPGTRQWLDETSKASYLMEWEGSDWRHNEIITTATVKIGLEDGNELLNDGSASMLVDMLIFLHRQYPLRRFRILDAGAGTGNTTKAILNELSSIDEKLPEGEKIAGEIVRLTTFYLLELSPARVDDISKGVIRHKLNPSCKILVASDSDMSPLLKDEIFDFVVSGAVFHHFSFPDYLSEIYRQLNDHGVLVFGDWHMSICEHPAHIVPLLFRLMKDDVPQDDARKIVIEFMNEFGVPGDDAIISFEEDLNGLTVSRERMTLPPEERAANILNREFIYQIGLQRQEMIRTGYEPKMYFLEALETIEEKRRALEDHGFLTDLNEIRAIRPEFRSLRTRNNVVGAYPHVPNIACSIAVAKETQLYSNLRKLRERPSWSPAPENPVKRECRAKKPAMS